LRIAEVGGLQNHGNRIIPLELRRLRERPCAHINTIDSLDERRDLFELEEKAATRAFWSELKWSARSVAFTLNWNFGFGRLPSLMRLFFALWLVWSCVHWAQGGEAKAKAAPSATTGPEYVSLQDWAKANQMQFLNPKKDEEVRLTNRTANLSLKVNSLRAEVNGVSLFLSAPVVLHQGVPSLSQRELDRAIKPVLFPSKNKTNQLVKTIVIGAGHGGKDCGFQVGSQQEKKYTLLLAQELKKLLTRAGFRTVLIRNSDQFIELEDRARLAKRVKADAYLELHYNCAGPGNNESKGVEVYCLTPSGANSTNGGSDSYPNPLPGNRHDERNVLLAYQLQNALVDKAGLADRGVRRARFVVLREAEMPAALVEAGFMSQPEELRRIQDPVHRRQTARALVDGLVAYKKLVER
jgi:N-acetylmuramoyl-L-alanine amidase